MTKEIAKAFILQRIEDKFGLRELTPEKFSFSEQVVPVYNIEQHLEEWWQRYLTKSITSSDPFPLFTIPAHGKWTLRSYDVVFMTGAFTIAGLYLKRKNGTPSDAYIYLDLKAAQSASYHIDLNPPVVCQPGDIIFVYVDGYTSTGDLRVYVDYKLETIR